MTILQKIFIILIILFMLFGAFALLSKPDSTLAMQTQLWRRTRSKREMRQSLERTDPFSLDAAIASIRARHRTHRDSIIFDPFRSNSTIFVNAN